MKITVAFNVTSYTTDNQMSIGKYPISDPLPLSLLPYKALEMDLMWGADSPKNPFGNYGKFEYGVRFTDFSDNAFGQTNLTVTNSWIHLVAPINPGMLNGDPSGNGRIQWDSAHCVWVNVVGNSDGSATAQFIYKTNQPINNAMFYTPVGRLGNVTSTNGPLGAWSVTFLNDTNVTLTAPSGDSSNFFLPADAAALFTDPLFAYFEDRPNNPSASLNTGQYATFSRIQIQGVATPLDDHFPGPGINSDPNNLIWVVLAEDPAGIAVVRADDLYWLGWSLPAAGFTLQANTVLTPSTWFDPSIANPVNFGSRQAVLISKDNLPGPKASFFRMVKP